MTNNTGKQRNRKKSYDVNMQVANDAANKRYSILSRHFDTSEFYNLTFLDISKQFLKAKWYTNTHCLNDFINLVTSKLR